MIKGLIQQVTAEESYSIHVQWVVNRKALIFASRGAQLTPFEKGGKQGRIPSRMASSESLSIHIHVLQTLKAVADLLLCSCK